MFARESMPGVALGMYGLFLAVSLGWRVWLQYRRTGDHGFRGFAGGRSYVEWFGTLFFVIGAALAGASPALELLGLVHTFQTVDTPTLHFAGLSLALLGFAVTVVAQHQMGDSWRVGVDTRETTVLKMRGLFTLVRNPIFSGMLLATFGLFLMTPNVLSAIAFGSLLVGTEVHVRCIEEPYLARVHGSRYLSYARAVGRFFPLVGRLS